VQSLADSAFRAQMDANQKLAEQGGRLAIVDPAFKPARPSGPGKTIFLLAGMVLFVTLGLSLAVGLAVIDDRLYRRADLERLGVAVLSVISPGSRSDGDRGPSGSPKLAREDLSEQAHPVATATLPAQDPALPAGSLLWRAPGRAAAALDPADGRGRARELTDVRDFAADAHRRRGADREARPGGDPRGQARGRGRPGQARAVALIHGKPTVMISPHAKPSVRRRRST